MKKWYDEEYEFQVEVTGFLRGDHTERYVCLGKGILAGLAAGLVYRAIAWGGKSHSSGRMLGGSIAAGIVSPVVNTGLFLLGLFFLFPTYLEAWATGAGQTKAVRKGLAFHRIAPPGSQPKMQANNTTAPNTPPRHAPAFGPYRAAPIRIGARASVMVKGPNLTKLATTCRTTIMAVIRASPVRRLVFSLALI